MSDRPPLKFFLKKKLDVQSPSLKYAAKAVTRTVILALDIPFPLLKATHEFLKIAEQGKRRNCWGKPRSPRPFDIYRHITHRTRNQGNDYNYVDLLEYCILGHTFAITESTVATYPAGIKKGFVKEEAIWLLRTNSSKVMFDGGEH